jgi:hypothetical protein
LSPRRQNREELDPASHRREVPDLVEGDRGYADASPRQELDEAFGTEQPKGFRDRGDADAAQGI